MNKTDDLIYKRGLKYYKKGLGIHWLRQNSKIPVQTKWASGKRQSIKELKESYKTGYNLGLRLGNASKIDNFYLAALDIDIRSTKTKHQKEAIEWVKETFKGLVGNTPSTISGRGNGSKHIWLLVDKPYKSQLLYVSKEEIEVFMPSVKATKEQIKKLGEKKVAEGWRVRPAWEVDFMCAGKQIVIPPSIHPDTGNKYIWGDKFTDVSDIKKVKIDSILHDNRDSRQGGKGDDLELTGDHFIKTWEPKEIDNFDLEMTLPPKTLSILNGERGEGDRSASVFSACMSMINSGLDDNTIISILTDKDNFIIAQIGYDHAKTKSRKRAAKWVYDYCLLRAKKEVDAAYVFDCEVEVNPPLSKEEIEKQEKEIARKKHWHDEIERTQVKDGVGRVKPTLKNNVLILANAVAPDIVQKNEFTLEESFSGVGPWKNKEGQLLDDTDLIKIKHWFAKKWRVEPSVNLIDESVRFLADANSFHPVRDYLQSLEWDGKKRVENFFIDYLGSKMPKTYLKATSRKFFLAAVSRIMNPGCKFDHMVIFEGKQGAGKSSIGKILAGEKWFSDDLGAKIQDKDAALNLVGTWFNEFGELAYMKKSEVEEIKAFVTRQVDKVRPPYGKRRIELKRQTIFYGTTNRKTYLKDPTGNRRYWPIEVMREIDLDKIKEDRDQLWAEAYQMYVDGSEPLFLEGRAKEQAEAIQEDKSEEHDEDILANMFLDWYEEERNKNDGFDFSKFKLTDLLSPLGGPFEGSPINVNGKAGLMKVAEVLRENNFEKFISGGRKFWREKENRVKNNGEIMFSDLGF